MELWESSQRKDTVSVRYQGSFPEQSPLLTGRRWRFGYIERRASGSGEHKEDSEKLESAVQKLLCSWELWKHKEKAKSAG